MPGPWIGCDLDGTLAFHTQGMSAAIIGAPIPVMVERVRGWLKDGITVKIVTARVADPKGRDFQLLMIKAWLRQAGLPALEVTNEKDYQMIELWDDRCVQVHCNTGRPVDGRS